MRICIDASKTSLDAAAQSFNIFLESMKVCAP